MRSLSLMMFVAVLAMGSLVGCAQAEPIETTQVPIVVDGSGIETAITNLGYAVTLSEARMVVEDLEFSTGGSAHTASWGQRIGEFFLSTAYAHPEHLYGGEVIGRLDGRFVIDWLRSDRIAVGLADMQVGSYASANFRFGRAVVEDGLADDDRLLGHTALLAGTATRDDSVIEFSILLDSPANRTLVGAPFQVDIAKDDERAIGLQLLTTDPFEHDTLFDDVDFAALSPNSAEPMVLREDTDNTAALDAYYAVRRTLQTHDQFRFDPLR